MSEVMKYLPVTVRFDGCYCDSECFYADGEWCALDEVTGRDDTPSLGNRGDFKVRTRWCCETFWTPDVDEHLPCHLCGKPMTNKECLDCKSERAVAASTEQKPDEYYCEGCQHLICVDPENGKYKCGHELVFYDEYYCEGCQHLICVDPENGKYKCGHELVFYDGVLRHDQCLAFDFKHEQSTEAQHD